MNDGTRMESLRHLAADFRAAIELARAEKAPGALPYFPEGACRMTSRLFALHLARSPEGHTFRHARVVSGVLPGSEPPARHYWLEFGGTVLDLTADPFGEPPVVVGPPTAFHQSLTERRDEDAAGILAALSAEESARLARQLAAIESRL